MITKAHGLCWFTILFNNQLQHIRLTHQTRQTGKKHSFKRLRQKVFVGPDFHTTKIRLNKVIKVGLLQCDPLSANYKSNES
jgi:hypothetical protein